MSELADQFRAAERIGAGEAREKVLAELAAAPAPVLATEPGRDPPLADGTLALRFIALHGTRIRFTPETGRWSRWDGRCWKDDTQTAVFDLVRKLARQVAQECTKDSEARAVFSASTVAAVERLARIDGRVVVPVELWDRDPWTLNTAGGIIDLQGGELDPKPHSPLSFCTKRTIAGLPDGATCPLWLQFLDRVTAGDGTLQRYLQRVAGYCLTGVTREHAMFFAYGTGGNGKSVFINTLTALLGDYARVAPMATFVESHTEQHPTDLAMLRGARLVVAQETEDGRRWAVSKIKALTGGDPITARFMRQDFFTYVPAFKLFIAGNHKPGLRAVDEAIRRRFHLIPFTVTIPADERDHGLQQKLEMEWDGILRWAIEGCFEWQRIGLDPPDAVRRATESYFADEDLIASWLADRCRIGAQYEDSIDRLFQSWKTWAEASGEYVGSKKAFSQALAARPQFEPGRTNTARTMRGLMVPVLEDARWPDRAGDE